MKLVIDTREQVPLSFPVMQDVEIIHESLSAGDYHARHPVGKTEGGVQEFQPDPSVIERKSLGDLYSSFTREYDREKAKWERAHGMGLLYILAIEGTLSEVLRGHEYWARGERHVSKKSGLAQIRQLSTLERKYAVRVWYCLNRQEMAWRILEWFRSFERCD